ncbi:MAG: hypothetical protein GY913_10905 [Proteobacteria bacterium]|nr:hypothetical protein [Pseudomonadota bacterium]
MTTLLILFACTDGESTDSSPDTDANSDTDSDTGPDTGEDCEQAYTGPVYIGFEETCPPFVTDGTAAIVWNCDSTDWWFDVYTVDWTTGGELWTRQTGSENPWDENHMIPVYDSDGESTLYPCDTPTMDSLTWHVVIYDTDGAEADCAVWGDEPESLGTGCEDWN